MCSTNSLRRHYRLPGIHCRRYSDRRAGTLRGSGRLSGPVAGRASLTCVCSRTFVSNGPGASYPAEERHANALCEADL
jgi:hypothetical protein